NFTSQTTTVQKMNNTRRELDSAPGCHCESCYLGIYPSLCWESKFITIASFFISPTRTPLRKLLQYKK
ncbi:hypothetical protein J6590_094687, partial [Homalodisca vitripennis]